MALSLTEFNRMVTEHGPRMYRMAYRMVGDRHEAEDLVQEAFRSAWKSRKLFRPGGGEKAWLASILRRRAADHWRRPRPPAVFAAANRPKPRSGTITIWERKYRVPPEWP